MANPTATVTDYCGVLTRSRLIPPAEVNALYHQWQTAATPAPSQTDVDSFRKFLVGRRLLTEYQAALLQRGHADGYFIGGYVVLDRIGKGQSAGVYKAVHSSGQTVALKVLPASKAKNAHTLARFQREGRLLTQLTHPNVVRAFQLGTAANGSHYIAMEHLDGDTLNDVLSRRGPFPPDEAARVVQQALEGLHHLHEKRMVHRDLKPANLMLVATPGRPAPTADTTLESTVKIVDIGLGRELFDDDSPHTPEQDLHLTAEGTILGTPDYLAPEQAKDARTADIRADIYALGCVLFRLLAGKPPFSERTVMATMVKHATEPLPPLRPLNPAVPPGLEAVVRKMTAKTPAERYDTPGEAAAALAPFLPSDAAAAESSQLLPAYEKFLDDESRAEMPVVRESSKESSKERPKPGTNPSPPLPSRESVLGLRGSGAAKNPPRAVVPPPELSAADFDVELIPTDPNADPLGRVVYTPPVRALYDLDRRDFIMLTAGAVGVAGAIAAGFLAARLMKGKAQGEEEDTRPNQP